MSMFGSRNEGGTPRWFNVLNLIPQMIVMPVLLLCSKVNAELSESCQRLFFAIFAHKILTDFSSVSLSKAMFIHHTTCLMGHMYAFVVAPEASDDYHMAVTVFEVGSGACNIWWSWRHIHPPVIDCLYAGMMTISNIIGYAACMSWALHAVSLHLASRALSVSIVLCLIHWRQKEMRAVLHDRNAYTT